MLVASSCGQRGRLCPSPTEGGTERPRVLLGVTRDGGGGWPVGGEVRLLTTELGDRDKGRDTAEPPHPLRQGRGAQQGTSIRLPSRRALRPWKHSGDSTLPPPRSEGCPRRAQVPAPLPWRASRARALPSRPQAAEGRAHPDLPTPYPFSIWSREGRGAWGPGAGLAALHPVLGSQCPAPSAHCLVPSTQRQASTTQRPAPHLGGSCPGPA